MKNSFSSLSDLAQAFGKEAPESTEPSGDDLVYSTESGRIKQEKTTQIEESDGTARVRRETKGRKGKGVLVVSDLGLDKAGLKKLASALKKACGTGGSVVEQTIEVQGDNREAVKQVLAKNGFKVKFTGG